MSENTPLLPVHNGDVKDGSEIDFTHYSLNPSKKAQGYRSTSQTTESPPAASPSSQRPHTPISCGEVNCCMLKSNTSSFTELARNRSLTHETREFPVPHGCLFRESSHDDERFSKLERLWEMRTSNLIGVGKPLVDWQQYRKSDEELALIKKRSVREFYENQNEMIDKYIDIDTLLDSGIPESLLKVYGEDLFESSANKSRRQGVPANIDSEFSDRGKAVAIVMFAIYVNFGINVILLGGKVVVTLLTSSLSIMASLIDSVLDLMSTVIIWFSTRLVEKRDWKTKHIYPVGRNRLEPIGVLVFSIVIIFSFLQVANSSIQKLLTSEPVATVQIGTASLLIMLFTILAKLFCYLWCKTIDSSAVAALAQDAMTDIVFNSFSIIFPFLGHYFEIWWLDPFGALFLSVYIIWTWSETALEHINNLAGAQATPLERQPLLYLCSRFSSSVSYVTALNAYHSGDRIVAEVDLVLDTNNSLRDSHDIGEAVQYALEGLDWVERGFVHLDYRRGNYEGHMPR